MFLIRALTSCQKGTVGAVSVRLLCEGGLGGTSTTQVSSVGLLPAILQQQCAFSCWPANPNGNCSYSNRSASITPGSWLKLDSGRTHQMEQMQQMRRMTCRASLGHAPPPKIVIEYDPQDVDVFIAMADAIEDAFPSVVVEGNEDGDGRAGAFEIVTSDGTPIFSKLESKRSPDPADVIDRIINRAKLPQEPASDGPMCG